MIRAGVRVVSAGCLLGAYQDVHPIFCVAFSAARFSAAIFFASAVPSRLRALRRRRGAGGTQSEQVSVLARGGRGVGRKQEEMSEAPAGAHGGSGRA